MMIGAYALMNMHRRSGILGIRNTHGELRIYKTDFWSFFVFELGNVTAPIDISISAENTIFFR
jgi:hypothetical protein